MRANARHSGRIIHIIIVSVIVSVLSFLVGVENKVKAADASGANLIWDGSVASSFAGGSGTATDPYIISTASELAYLAESVNSGTSYGGKYIKLANSIYLNGMANYDNWSATVIPDNVWNGMNDFCGEIDGDGHAIYGMYVKRSEKNAGFINSTKYMSNSSVSTTGKAIIKNLNFKNSYVYGTENVGTVIGKAEYAIIKNCKIEGKVIATKASSYAGGIIGYFSSGGNRGLSITDSTNNSIVSGNSYVGGLVGSASVGNSSGYSTSGNGSEKIVIKDCENCGIVEANGDYVGGIAGKIFRSMNCGGLELKNIGNQGNIVGSKYVGGIFGRLTGSYYAISLDESYNSGTVSGASYIGGIVGMADSGTSASRPSMKNLYNVGNINANSYVGGIFGAGSYVSILYCYNKGNVDGQTNSAALVGSASSVSDPYGLYGDMVIVKYSYYLNSTSSVGTVGAKTNVQSFTEKDINNCDTFEGFDFDNTWKMCIDYPILQWQQGEDIRNTKKSDIIKRVEEYTSDELYSQYDVINNSGYSPELEQKKYYELFTFYGFTDVREGIQYLSNTTQKRYAYLSLITDEIYCAHGYQYWLDHTEKGRFARALLLADGLIFNQEINDWLSFDTYADSDYPGVKKYKEMLYDFMESTTDKIDVMSDIKLVNELAKNVNDSAKLKADDLIKKLNTCKTIEEAQEYLKSTEAKGVFAELTSKRDSKGNPVFDFELDETSGFGQFAKASKYASKGISLMNISYERTLDFMMLDSKLAIYTQYQTFLQDVVNDTENLPFQLRWAAQQIINEMEEGYAGVLKDIAFDILNMSSIDSKVLETIIGETGYSTFSQWLQVINIEAYFINKIADVGEMVKKEAYVEGYAYLSAAYKSKLEQAKQNFLTNKTEENAWNFYYNYNMLYQLRHKGEESYLAFSKVGGIAGKLNDFGYSAKELVVKDTLDMLEKRCKFEFEEDKNTPASCQFAVKGVVNCPVNVTISTVDGKVIAKLEDKKECDITNEYGRFAVIYNAFVDDYQKVFCLSSDEDYKIDIEGMDDGLVAMELAQQNEENKVYAFRNVAITKDAIIKTSVKQLVEEQNYSIDTDGDGVAEVIEATEIIGNEYIPVESVEINNEKLEMFVGDTTVLRINIYPKEATSKEVTWISSNPDVVTVKDGKVTAISKGEATVYGIVAEHADVYATCSVIVSQENHSNAIQEGKDVNTVGTVIINKNSGMKYKITRIDGADSEVELVKYFGKKRNVVIPDTITDGKIVYKVTSIANHAFYKNKNLKSVTIGRNVKTIGKECLKSCKNLKKITIKSKKLKRVGKNALKGIKSSAKIKVPSSKLKVYRKLFKKKGQSKKVKIVR